MLFEAVCERYRAINPTPRCGFRLFFTLQHSLRCGEKEEPLVLEIRQIRADSVHFERDFDEGELSDLISLKISIWKQMQKPTIPQGRTS